MWSESIWAKHRVQFQPKAQVRIEKLKKNEEEEIYCTMKAVVRKSITK